MKRYASVVTAMFVCFLGLFMVASLALPPRSFSETENRTLAQLPEFSWQALRAGTYTKDMETYLADQFPLRDRWIALKSGAQYVLGQREFNGVYLCGDTLISKVEEPDEKELEKKLGYLQRLTQLSPVPVYGAWIPSAAQIWSEKLPKGAASFDQQAFLKTMQEKTQLQYVDLLGALSSHAQEPIFYRTDHHWTSLGAYYGYCALIEAMGETPVSLEQYDPTTVTEDFYGTLYSTSGVHWLEPDSIETYVPASGIEVIRYDGAEPRPGALYDASYLEKKDKYSMFLGGNQPLCILKNPDAPLGKVLVVRDSYCDAMAPFLSQSFSEVYLVDLRYYRTSVATLAQEYGVDAVVVLYSVPNFLTDTNLVFLGQ